MSESKDLNQELEELLDAELTEEEIAAVEVEISELDEAEEVGGVVKMKTPTAKAKPLKTGGGEKSELSDDSEDLGKAVTSPEDKDSGGGKAADKAKKAKPTNSAPAGDKPEKLAAGDEVEHDGEQLEEARMTKAKMLEDLGKMVEGLGKMKATDLKGVHEKLKKIVNGDPEDEDDEEEDMLTSRVCPDLSKDTKMQVLFLIYKL